MTAEKTIAMLRALVRSPVMATARTRTGPRWMALLDVNAHVFVWSFECSLSRRKQVGLPLVSLRKFGPNFR